LAAYYNENDPYAARWLRNLIAERLIADGEVDTRSIVDHRPAAVFIRAAMQAIGGEP
jgi:DNA (cytosine-5)-methyltransferase 1